MLIYELLGHISLVCWFLVMVPQIYTNYKLKNATSLSPFYVTLNIVGNFISFTGAILGDLILSTKLVTGYLTLLGSILFLQIYLYRPVDLIKVSWKNVTRSIKSGKSRLSVYQSYQPLVQVLEDEVINDDDNNESIRPEFTQVPNNYNFGQIRPTSISQIYEDEPLLNSNLSMYSTISRRSSIAKSIISNHHIDVNPTFSNKMNSIRRLSIQSTLSYPNFNDTNVNQLNNSSNSTESKTIDLTVPFSIILITFFTVILITIVPLPAYLNKSQLLGWFSSSLFFFSRLPQLYLNYKRKSVEGLAITMFLISIIGNVTYLGAIILFSLNYTYLMTNLPWILGGAFGLVMDFIVIYQFFRYADNVISYEEVIGN